jgi:RHS repeat-associated protein
VLSSHLFDAFGLWLNTAPVGPFGYGGQWGYSTDSETGLLLLTNRYYDPGTGRFVTRDPIGYAGGAEPVRVCGQRAAPGVRWGESGNGKGGGLRLHGGPGRSHNNVHDMKGEN